MASSNQPIILIKKKKKKGGHDGHHGGAWKVAYADFVTAMMAFFLLLWLLNVTTDEQKRGIADYFDPASVSRATSGSGGVLGGLTVSSPGQLSSANARFSMEQSLPGRPEPVEDSNILDEGASDTPSGADGQVEGEPQDGERSEAELAADAAAYEQQQFEQAAEALQQAIHESPELKELEDNLLIDQTPEGLRIQIVDEQRFSMFESGSAAMTQQTRQLLGLVAQVIARMPNEVAISGHTDGMPYAAGARYDNWELSSDRANASRRGLVEAGIDPARIARVTGRADTEHLNPDDPLDPSNRRISIVLLREQLAAAARIN